MEERGLRELPPIEDLIARLSSEESVFMVYEDLASKSRRSIVAWAPEDLISGSNSEVFEKIRRKLRGSEIEVRSGLRRALFGYVSYDAVRLWERVKDLRPYPEPWPYVELFEPENVVLYDYANGKAFLEVVDDKVLNDAHGRKMMEPLGAKFHDAMLSGKEFKDAVGRALECIKAGYVFQVVLSRFERYVVRGDLARLYLTLRCVSPSPYTYFAKFRDRSIIGSSPELLFSVDDGVVETYPIAGTRPRGSCPKEDRALEAELISSKKDLAEHLMLVDLARNDLGKVSCAGTVRVDRFMYVEKYSHVQHIVSKVVGVLKSELDFVDVLKAMLPAGTVSGAPKPFALNLIEELERFKRGPYAGAIGLVRSAKKGEMAIIIRSAFAYRDLLRVQAGAGVVYDSKPSSELEETEHKLSPLKEALKRASRPLR